MRSTLLIGLSLLATCCVHDSTVVFMVPDQRVIPVYVSDEFTTEDTGAIFDAAQEWNQALKGHVYFDVITHSTFSMDELKDISETGGVAVTQIFSSCKCIPFQIPDALAWTDKLGGSHIFMVKDRILSPENMKWVAMHELGHVLGAKDRIEPGLMSGGPQIDRWSCIDHQTMLEVTLFEGLKMSEVQWCSGPT